MCNAQFGGDVWSNDDEVVRRSRVRIEARIASLEERLARLEAQVERLKANLSRKYTQVFIMGLFLSAFIFLICSSSVRYANKC